MAAGIRDIFAWINDWWSNPQVIITPPSEFPAGTWTAETRSLTFTAERRDLTWTSTERH